MKIRLRMTLVTSGKNRGLELDLSGYQRGREPEDAEMMAWCAAALLSAACKGGPAGYEATEDLIVQGARTISQISRRKPS